LTALVGLLTGTFTLALVVSGVGLAVLLVGLYWLYTLQGLRLLGPLVSPPARKVGFAIAALQSFAWGPVLSMYALSGGRDGDVGLLAGWLLGPPVLVGAAIWYALKRQWLEPRPAAPLSAFAGHPGKDALVAVLPGGEAVGLAWMRRSRTATVGDLCVVHCGVARSLAAIVGAGAAPKAWMPHASGFSVRSGGIHWDGVDGTGLVDPASMARAPVGLCTFEAWRAAYPDARLLRPEPFAAPRPARNVVVAGAREVADAMRWGVVEDGAWRALSDADLAVCPDVGDSAPRRYYLSRWAARVRGLLGTDA